MPADTKPRQPSKYWMRSVSFAGLHRLLYVVAEHPEGLRPRDINRLVIEKNIPLMHNHSCPSPTSLYHYRNALIHLGVLVRDGSKLRANLQNTEVRGLLQEPISDEGVKYLSKPAQEYFGNLVLQNEQCRSLFFDLFMPGGVENYSVAEFRQRGTAAEWSRPCSKEVLLYNSSTEHIVSCRTPTSINAILYGLRYWARDEIKLIDEYCLRSGEGVVMFPLSRSISPCGGIDDVMKIAKKILSYQISDEWRSFSIYDLIKSVCVSQKISINLLFRTIDWLIDEWPGNIMLIPTSRGLATITAGSSQREEMELRQYYRRGNGPYISHIRIHRNVNVDASGRNDYHAAGL